MDSNKKMIQQALHKGLYHTRPRTQSLGDINNTNNRPSDLQTPEQNWTVVTGKRPRSSPESQLRQNKQAKVDQYWLSKPVTVSNSFSELGNELQDDQTDEQEHSQQTVKVPRPPPIFVDKVGNIQPLIELLSNHAKENYVIKVLHNEQVKIQPKSAEYYKIIVTQLELKGTEFYTYKPKQERTYKAVLKNIHPSTPIDDIKTSLCNLGHTPTNIWNIKARTTKKPLPIFFIELQPSSNNKDIFKIKYLLNCQVNIEEPIPKRTIPQCAKCQQYGHTKSYCRRQPKCIKCAGDHMSAECIRKTRSDEVKCVLCEGNHPANYKGCTIYKQLQKSKYPSLRRQTVLPTIETPTLPKPKQQTRLYSEVAAKKWTKFIYRVSQKPPATVTLKIMMKTQLETLC